MTLSPRVFGKCPIIVGLVHLDGRLGHGKSHEAEVLTDMEKSRLKPILNIELTMTHGYNISGGRQLFGAQDVGLLPSNLLEDT